MITQIYYNKEKNALLCSHNEEFLRKILELHKIGSLLTAAFRPKGNSVQTQEVGVNLKYRSFCINEVPVESFVGSSTGTHC